MKFLFDIYFDFSDSSDIPLSLMTNMIPVFHFTSVSTLRFNPNNIILKIKYTVIEYLGSLWLNFSQETKDNSGKRVWVKKYRKQGQWSLSMATLSFTSSPAALLFNNNATTYHLPRFLSISSFPSHKVHTRTHPCTSLSLMLAANGLVCLDSERLETPSGAAPCQVLSEHTRKGCNLGGNWGRGERVFVWIWFSWKHFSIHLVCWAWWPGISRDHLLDLSQVD